MGKSVEKTTRERAERSMTSRELTGAEEGGAGCGTLPGGGVGIPHGQTVHVQIGGDTAGLNSN